MRSRQRIGQVIGPWQVVGQSRTSRGRLLWIVRRQDGTERGWTTYKLIQHAHTFGSPPPCGVRAETE